MLRTDTGNAAAEGKAIIDGVLNENKHFGHPLNLSVPRGLVVQREQGGEKERELAFI
jgi:hypothetical protein